MQIRQQNFSPELRDIIERPQDKFSIGAAVFLIIFILIMVILGCTIKSPDKIVASVRVSSNHPPVTIKTQSSGKIQFIIDSFPCHSELGQYLACICNAADYNDIEKLSKSLDRSNPFSTASSTLRTTDLSLGEVGPAFYDYQHAVQKYKVLTCPQNEYASKIQLYKERLESDLIELMNLEKSQNNSKQQFCIKRKNHSTDSLLYLNGVILERDFSNSQLDLLNAERYVISGQSSIDAKMHSIQENRLQIESFQQEYNNQIKIQQLQVEMTHTNLLTQIENWETKYILKTTEAGRVEFANLISDGDFVMAGTPVFNVIFDNSRYYAVALLQTDGAGKVQVGAKVNLKLDSFPYAEYGTLSGIVDDISQHPIDMYYLVHISLPAGLTSSSGTKLFFAETLYGQAEIITSDRLLISRIFNSIYKIMTTSKERKQENNEDSPINF